MLEINQTIVFALFMVIIGAFIGTEDLGQYILKALSDLKGGGKGLILGICVAFIAIAFDNLIRTYAEKRKKELGFVGSPKEIDLKGILKIIKEKKIPIVVPMGTSDDKKTYNINADIAAGSVAKELNSRRLLLMTDVEGVLDRDKKLIPEINSSIAEKMLKDGDISGGMIPKINTCLDAVNNGVTGVVIVDGRKPHSILFELFSDKGAGTLIRK